MPPKKAVDLSKITIPVWAKPGKAIWVEIMDKEEIEPKEYYKGRIDQVFEDKKLISIIYEGADKGDKEILAHRVLERSEEPQVLEDLVDVDPLNDAELLRCLELRFRNDDVYCFCGPTLLATNPYKKIDKSALPEHKEMFRKYALQGGKKITMPHIWNLASNAFWQLFENGKKQACCISGESGAGKTVGTKLCMGFVTSLFEGEDGGEKSDEVPIEDKILDCNPIMESFGNSKTVRNDNSSRFGKYFIMYVDKQDKHIKGAEIKNYLLEKSRIVIQAETERNYHVFYGILRFMDKAKLKKYGYCNKGDDVDMTQFNYLRKSKCFTWETINDKEFFDDTANSFNRLGFDAEEQEAVYKTLACVLNLGNVDIEDVQKLSIV